MRSPEQQQRQNNTQENLIEENKKKFESGYSEEQQALDREVRSGDLQSLKNSHVFKNLHGAQKTVAAYRSISYKLSQLVDEYTQLVQHDLHRAQRMIDEIKKFRAMQKILLTKLFGKLDENFPEKKFLEEELQDFLE
jgi:hypothetical protein